MLNIKKNHTAAFGGAVDYNKVSGYSSLFPDDRLWPYRLSAAHCPIRGSAPAGYRRGSVLIFTLVILLLMTLMGAALLVNSRTELQISGTTAKGRDAFTKADATARVALMFTRAYLHPTAGNPRDYLNADKTGQGGRKPFEIIPDADLNSMDDLQVLKGSITVDEIKERYLQITDATGVPHFQITYGEDKDKNGVVVGTAYVGLAHSGSTAGGGSIGERDYGAADAGYSITAFLVVSAQGRVEEGENKGFIDEDRAGVHSIVTTIFREVLP